VAYLVDLAVDPDEPEIVDCPPSAGASSAW
jgi:hypothetical protein